MIAVPVVRMVKMPVDDVVDVTGVRDGRVAATWSVRVRGVPGAIVLAACGGVGRAGFELVLVHVIAMHEVKVPVVEVILVIAVANAGVAATVSVNVIVLFVGFVVHRPRPFLGSIWARSRARAQRE